MLVKVNFDLTVVSEADTVIYTWRYYITACSKGTNVTRFLSRYDCLVRTNGQVAFKEPPVINMRGITPDPHTWSHIQRRVVYCVNLTTQDRCSESLPWSRIHLYQDHTWNAEWEGGWYPNNRGRIPF